MVVNCAGPFYKTAVAVARAAVEAKVNYIDICDDYEATEILFASDIDQAAKEAGITVLTGMGSDPGTNNVLVKWYADHWTGWTRSHLFWVVSIAELAGAAWDHSLHMTIGKNPPISGRPTGPCGRRHRCGDRPIPGTPGHLSGALCGSPPAAHHPALHQGREKSGDQGALIPLWVDELIKEQKETGFLSKEPVEIKGTKVTPYDLTLRLWDTIPQGPG